MTLSPQWLDELRARTLLSGVIAPSVKLIKAGREFKACCPFHSEKTPRFTVNDEKGFYHCFGCGAHGDAIRFLTDQRGLPFMDAVKELAGKAGMEVPAADPKAKERQERAAGLHDVMAEAQRWFAETLHGIEGGAARDYLSKRGIEPAAVQRFGIGFAPDSRGKLKAALDRFGEAALVDTGMLIKPPADEGDKPSYDRFRGRLMIPIRDARGRVIGFGGRILGAGEPKYLNSPETVLFDKGRSLYNIDRASPASRKAGRLIVVEGYMDVIGLDRAGIGEAVAPNGTSVTEAQLELMWRLDPAPILCFDGDSAGQKAAVRAALRALPLIGPEKTLRFVALPAGQDPDDLVRAGGKAAVEALLAEPVPLVERLWSHELAAQPLTTPEARAGLKARLLAHTQAIADPTVRQLYRDEWLQRFDALVRPRRGHGQARGRAFTLRDWKKRNLEAERFLQAAGTLDATRRTGSHGVEAPIARALLAGFRLFPDVLHEHVEDLAFLPIADAGAARLRDRLVEATLAADDLDRAALATILAAEGLTGATGRPAMRFSFTRPGTDPARARSDLAAALEAAVAGPEIEAALAEATVRMKGDITDDTFADQQRLLAAQRRYHEKLAQLAGNG